jgi:homoserine O-acetyltransferase
VNLNSKDGVTVTTGPASIDPATGRPYGLHFPVVTIPDFVRVQKALLDSLGIRRLRMVGGPSMGALQAFEWAAAHPEMVERVLAVTGVPVQAPNAMVELGRWCSPIRSDPNWQRGDYYGRAEPLDGVTQGFINIFTGARHPEYTARTFGYRPADEACPPLASVEHLFAGEAAFHAAARDRAVRTTDANHMLYMTRANQLFVPGLGSSVDGELKRIRAKVLLMPARTDLLFPPEQVRTHYERLAANGNDVQWAVIDTGEGHIGGISDVATQAGTIGAFLGNGGR